MQVRHNLHVADLARRQFFRILVLAVAAAPLTNSFAATITTSDDAVFRGGALSNFTFTGAALEINAANDGSGGDVTNSAKSWLKFDLSGLAADVKSLTLEIEPGTATAAPVNFYGLIGPDSWNDTTTTWNTAPGNDTARAVDVLSGSVFGGTSLGSFTHVSGFNIVSSPALADYINSERVANGGDDGTSRC